MKNIMKNIMIFLMWYPLRIVINLFPSRAVYAIGVAGGFVLYILSGDKKKIMEEELKKIMPDKTNDEIDRIARESFVNYCISEMEVLLYPSLNCDFIKENIVITGLENLDTALAKGKGVLLFQSHFGAFQMTMPAIGYSGYKMNQISASALLWNEEAEISLIQRNAYKKKARYEYSLPVNHISVRSSLRPVFRALEKNEIVGITVDGGGGNKTVLIDFLGRKANFQQGSADLAIRTGAAIVPVFIITEKGLKHRLVLQQPLNLNTFSNREVQIREVLQEFGRRMEAYVYRYPSHYGYTLFLRSSRALRDAYPFFADYKAINNNMVKNKPEGIRYA